MIDVTTNCTLVIFFSIKSSLTVGGHVHKQGQTFESNLIPSTL
jgi:hypothetical protein